MLRPSKGDMYEFVTYTWNPVSGKCYHNCKYCYMKQINPNAGQLRLAVESFEDYLGRGHYIFIGSSTDLFADNVPSEWIKWVLKYCQYYNDPTSPNKFLLQSKNPRRFLEFINHPLMEHVEFCTTLETNRFYPDIMNNAPRIEDRVEAMERIAELGFKTMITAEPLMDFDLDVFAAHIRRCKPQQVNIGKESFGMVKLPEPTPEKVRDLAATLSEFTKVKIKKNAMAWFK